MTRHAPPLWSFALLAMLTAGAVAAGFIVDAPETWRFAVTLLAGLGAGSVLLAMLGQLLGRDWLEVLEDELLPGAMMLPLAAVLAIPLLAQGAGGEALRLLDEAGATAQQRWWFAPPAMLVRLALLVGVGVALAVLLARFRGARSWISAIGLPVFAMLVALATLDWVVVREPLWWTALQPIAFVVIQLTGALAVAFVHNLGQREPADRAALASIAAALLTLALLAVWIAYVQYLIAWYGNLPDAAAWYGARMAAGGWLVPVFAALQLIGIAILLFSRAHAAMLAASLALLGAYLTNAVRLAGEAAPQDAAQWAVAGALLVLGVLWHILLNRAYDARISAEKSSRAPVRR